MGAAARLLVSAIVRSQQRRRQQNNPRGLSDERFQKLRLEQGRRMFTTLVAVLCHSLAGIPSPICVEEVVTDTNFTMLAGKVDDPISMPGINMNQCLIEAQKYISDWMGKHPVYHSWQLASWKCVPGHYQVGKRA
jgi:hypothetical protein